MTADPSAIVIRDARAADVPALVALLTDDPLGAAREGPADDPAYAAAFDAVDRDPNHRLLVAERGGAVVGCLQLSFLPGLARRGAWRGQIEGVRVAEAARGAGVGALLFEAAERIASARACALVQLTSDKTRRDAHRFYQQRGYVASHEGFKKPIRR